MVLLTRAEKDSEDVDRSKSSVNCLAQLRMEFSQKVDRHFLPTFIKQVQEVMRKSLP